MVKLDRDAAAPGPIVTGFTARGFRCGEREFTGGLLLTPDEASDWDAPGPDALDAAALDDLLGIVPPPEFLLLGTGATLARPPAAFVSAVEERGIGVEAMDSRAAARSWGLLRGEGRWIVAALLPLDA